MKDIMIVLTVCCAIFVYACIIYFIAKIVYEFGLLIKKKIKEKKNKNA